MTDIVIAPSLLSADFARLGEEAESVLQAGADWLHFDVMDNHYVPNLTIGPMVCQALRDYGVTVPIDVHLMTSPVDSLITQFAKAGASLISFHPEASSHVHRSVQLIKDHGCQAGLVYNPASGLDALPYMIDEIDMVLIMSVNPGFGGQQFITSSVQKIAKVRQMITDSGRAIRLAVDGGINSQTIVAACTAGADTFVAGSAIFGASDYTQAIRDLRCAATV